MTILSSAPPQPDRLGGLRRFAVAITILNVLGHTVFGFEQSWATPFVSLAAAYGMELLLEMVDARVQRRRPRFLGGPMTLVSFLLSAHISGLAVGMLLYANARLWPIALASAAAIASKALFRVRTRQGSCHFMNPSNFGISLTLLLFPWVGIAPPYQFTEQLDGVGDWLLPGFIVLSGSFLNWRFTKRLPLILAWVFGFAAQAFLRHWILDARLESALAPMTGTAFILFSFYMVSDPATTPIARRSQVVFGAFTAMAYGALMAFHVVFGLFFSLSLVCCARGLVLWTATQMLRVRQPAPERAEEPAVLAVASQ